MKNFITKIASLLLIVFISFGIVACDGGKQPENVSITFEASKTTITAEETIVVRNAILKKINYEKITIDPDGE